MSEDKSALDKILEDADFISTFNNQREFVFARYQYDSVYSFNGGTFNVDRNLIVYVKMMIDEGQKRDIILDRNNNPIVILNLQDFYDNIRSAHSKATNSYYSAYHRLVRARKAHKVIENS